MLALCVRVAFEVKSRFSLLLGSEFLGLSCCFLDFCKVLAVARLDQVLTIKHYVDHVLGLRNGGCFSFPFDSDSLQAPAQVCEAKMGASEGTGVLLGIVVVVDAFEV